MPKTQNLEIKFSELSHSPLSVFRVLWTSDFIKFFSALFTTISKVKIRAKNSEIWSKYFSVSDQVISKEMIVWRFPRLKPVVEIPFTRFEIKAELSLAIVAIIV